jgi:hypothetical protein
MIYTQLLCRPAEQIERIRTEFQEKEEVYYAVSQMQI